MSTGREGFDTPVASELPIDEAVHPFLTVGCLHANIVIGVSFHHSVSVLMFEQYAAALSDMLFGEVPEFHEGEVSKQFIAFLPDVYRHYGFDLKGFCMVSFGVGEDVQVAQVQFLEKVEGFLEVCLRF